MTSAERTYVLLAVISISTSLPQGRIRVQPGRTVSELREEVQRQSEYQLCQHGRAIALEGRSEELGNETTREDDLAGITYLGRIVAVSPLVLVQQEDHECRIRSLATFPVASTYLMV